MDMSVVRMIKDEIALECRILSRLAVLGIEASLVCKESGGLRRFYLKKEKKGRPKYLRRSEYGAAEKVLQDKVAQKTREVLEKNIRELEKILKKINDYDMDSILKKMPAAYARFHDELFSRDGCSEAEFPQSENTKDRAGLKYRTSFGLFVRSKNEVLIAEALYAAGLEFWYEKRLELVVKSGDGYNTDVEYPDFTIRLPDGSIVYWEHFGMMDKKDYQEKNYRKLQNYLANGIYPPHNMILTFDGENMPFDNGAVWRIIQGQLLG